MSLFNDKYRIETIRIPEYDYSQIGVYFITICSRNHENLFGEIINGTVELNDFGKLIMDYWKKIEIIRPNVKLDEYIVMPNHIHGIIEIFDTSNESKAKLYKIPSKQERKTTQWVVSTGPRSGSIGAIIGQFKSAVSKQIKILTKNNLKTIWQSNYYEHVIRNENELNKIREYIINNPLNWENNKNNIDI